MSFKHIDPARGYYILETVEEEQNSTFKTPPATEGMPLTGKIVGVGGVGRNEDGDLSIDPDYELGDVIIYPRYVDNKIKLNGKEFTVVKFRDVMGKLVEEAK